ncbi:MAG: hypothetical protein V1773_15255 [bacterium]
MSKKHFLAVLFFIFIQSIYGQGEGAIPTLTFQQSPLLQGAGSIGTAIPQYDASGFYLNPAQLGNFASKNNLSLFVMPEKTEWGSPYLKDLEFSSFGIAAGYNFENKNKNLPLSIGVGYIHNKFDYGKSFYESYTTFDCFSIGASYQSFLLFNFGFSIKSYSDKLGNTLETGREIKAEGTAFDFGLMVTAPLTKLLPEDFKLNLDNNSSIRPVSNFSLGYALLNVGKEVSYIDEEQADPISRTARFGYSFNFGLELNTKLVAINVIDYSFTAEAEDILAKKNIDGHEYQNIFGNIKLGKNLILLKSDNEVIVRIGHIFKFFETLIITSGRFSGKGYDLTNKTDGIGFSSEGLFKLLNSIVDNSAVNYITKHFALEYYDTNTFVDSPMKTNFKGLVLTYRGYNI